MKSSDSDYERIKNTTWDNEFEEEIAEFFVDAGFKFVGGGQNYYPYGKKHRQIDVHMRFEDKIYPSYDIFIECKAKETIAPDDIRLFRDTVRTLRHENNNAIGLFISDQEIKEKLYQIRDDARIKFAIFSFFEYDYFWNLVETIEENAKFELLDFLIRDNGFAEGLSSNKHVKFDVLPTKQKSFEILMFHCDADTLRRIAAVPRLRRRYNVDYTEKLVDLYQRMLKKNKLNKIKKYLEEEEEGFFPNNLIINLLEKHPENGKIEVPIKFGSLRLIDGQHRLFGVFKSKEIDPTDFVFPCVGVNIDERSETRLFETINEKQTKIDPSLIDYLKFNLGEFEKSNEEHCIKAAIGLAMDEDKGLLQNLFRNHIYLGFGDKNYFVGDYKYKKLKLRNTRTSIKYSIYGYLSKKYSDEEEIIEETARMIKRWYIALAQQFKGKKVWHQFLFRDGGFSVMLHILNKILEEKDDSSKDLLDRYAKKMDEEGILQKGNGWKSEDKYISEVLSSWTAGEGPRKKLADHIWNVMEKGGSLRPRTK